MSHLRAIRDLRTSGPFLLGLVPVAVCLAPLLTFTIFGIEWVNHAWLIEHTAARLRADGFFPIVHETAAIEAGFPLFYGYLFYPLAALPATLVGPDGALRLIVAALTALVYAALYRCVLRLGGAPWLAAFTGLVPVLAIYQLSNLYSRSAITEFVGFCLQCLLVAHLVTYVRGATLRPPLPSRFADLGLAVLCLVLLVGTHPISAYLTVLAGLFVVPLLLVAARWRPARGDLLAGAGFGLLATLCVLPWLLGVLAYQRHLPILFPRLGYYAGIDWPLARLVPIPIDFRSTLQALPFTDNPFLEAPVNLLLLALPLLIALFVCRGSWPRGWARLYLGGAGVLVALTLALVIVSIYEFLPGPSVLRPGIDALFASIQFAYRLVGTINLLGVVLVLYVLLGARHLGDLRAALRRAEVRYVAVVLATLVVAAATFKTVRVYALTRPAQQAASQIVALIADYPRIIADPDALPPTFYGDNGYAMPGLFASASLLGPISEQVAVPLHRAANGFESQPAVVTCSTTCLLRTNVTPSGLIALRLNGRLVERVSTYVVEGKLAVVGRPGENVVQFVLPRQNLVALNAVVAVTCVWLVAGVSGLVWSAGREAGWLRRAVLGSRGAARRRAAGRGTVMSGDGA